MIIGQKETFAFEIGEVTEKSLRIVDIIINNRYVCCDDNIVYVPQFITDLKYELSRIENLRNNKFQQYLNGKSITEIHKFIISTRHEESENYDLEGDEIYPYFRFMNLGPTTDNFSSFIFYKNNDLYITYEFWRETHTNKEEIGHVFFTKVKKDEIIQYISETINMLENKI